MNTFCRKFVIACVGLVVVTGSAVAKRVPPKPVSPVISGGIRYSAEGNGRDQYVVAADVSSGKVLWKVKVFHNNINFELEEDVQHIFITDLKLVDNSLFVRDEALRCYSTDLGGKGVKKQRCDAVFSQ